MWDISMHVHGPIQNKISVDVDSTSIDWGDKAAHLMVKSLVLGQWNSYEFVHGFNEADEFRLDFACLRDLTQKD